MLRSNFNKAVILYTIIIFTAGLVTGAIFVSYNVSLTLLKGVCVLNRTCVDNAGVLTLLLVILAVVGLLTELLRLRH